MTIDPTATDSHQRTGSPERRPRLLYLARNFPPATTPACVRTWNCAKYLTRLGWEVIVVTLNPLVWRRIDNPNETSAALDNEGIQRILTDHRWRWLDPEWLDCWDYGPGPYLGGLGRKIFRYLGIDSGIGWVLPAEQACSNLTAKDIDLILATGAPFAAFELAHSLSKRLKRPYVLDYRDPWTRNPHSSRKTPLPNSLRKETRLLADCTAVTIVSSSWGKVLDDHFRVGSKLHIISNGFDPEELEEVAPHEFGHFAIVYTGNFYPPKRVISPIFKALSRLKESKIDPLEEWYFHYYGPREKYVREEAIRFGILERVILHGTVPRSEALAAVRGAGTVVVITSVANEITSGDKGIVTSKIFDALGLGARMLLISPPGSDVEAITENNKLVNRFEANNTDGMARFLKDMLGRPVSEIRICEDYAWTNIAKKLDSVLRSALDSGRG